MKNINNRFRGFLPVVVDVETGGFNSQTDALLEIAAVILTYDDQRERWWLGETHSSHVIPFEGANMEPKSMEVNGIIPDHPLRFALQEIEALEKIFTPIREALVMSQCSRAILVGHNPAFDLSFINAAIKRNDYKKSPFHSFSTFDTATLAGMAFGQTVLARAVKAAGIEWDARDAHSAIYDAEMTAQLFCTIINLWGNARNFESTLTKHN